MSIDTSRIQNENKNAGASIHPSLSYLNKQAEQAALLMSQFNSLLLEQKREQWLDLFDENILFEFPYAGEGVIASLNGKQALAEHMNYFDSIIRMNTLTEPVIHQTLNPDVFIAQFRGKGQLLQTGQVYDQHYISVIEVKNNRIIRYQDYWNPLAVAGS